MTARQRSRQRLQESLSAIVASRVAMVGLVLVLFWVLIAVLAPIATGYNPLYQDYKNLDQAPSAQHILGTDHMGRDVWSRVAFGARTILTLGPISVLVAFLVGIALGLPAGYYGGWLDEAVMRILDALMAFPTILLYMIIISA
ncbi:MAG TPA: ABC transporter permease, partial [Anaerolineae bacterium]|nr:ABC transporter permease [Anaerolineae bacterium]